MKKTDIIAQKFSKAHKTYLNQAHMQEEMSLQLIANLTKRFPKLHTIIENESLHIADLGCGSHANTITKLLEQFKLQPYSHVALVDIVPVQNDSKIYQNTIHQKRIFINTYVQDVYLWLEEQINKNITYDVIISNAMIQWLNDKNLFFKLVNKCLNKNGFFAFTSFANDNLEQLKKLNIPSLNYNSLDEYKNLLIKNNFDIKVAEEWKKNYEFNNPLDVLRHFKYTGVNSLTNKIWTKKDLIKFSQNYRQFLINNKYPITYNPLLIICNKI